MSGEPVAGVKVELSEVGALGEWKGEPRDSRDNTADGYRHRNHPSPIRRAVAHARSFDWPWAIVEVHDQPL
jgi:hypothetical protein